MHPMGNRSFPERLPPGYDWEEPEGAAPEATQPGPMDPSLVDTGRGPETILEAAPTFSSRILWLAAIASVIWLALAGAVVYLVGGTSDLSRLTLTEWSGVAAGIAAPLSAIWLIALVTARVYPGQQRETLARVEAAELRFAQTAAATRNQLETIDSVLGEVTRRIDGLRQVFATEVDGFVSATDAAAARTRTLALSLAGDREGIESSTDRLVAASERARAEFVALGQELPVAETQVQRIADILQASAKGARQQLQETEDLLAAVWTRSEDSSQQARRAVDGLTTVLTAISTSAADAEGRLQTYAAQLEDSADAALAKTGEALEATRQGVDAQTRALAAAIARSTQDLDDLGGRAVDTIAARLLAISDNAAMLADRLAAQDANSQGLLQTLDRGFGVLDAKLNNAAQSTTSVLQALSMRIEQVRSDIDTLAQPIDTTRGATGELERSISSVRTAAQETLAALSSGVPEGAEVGITAVNALRASVGGLVQDFDRLKDRASVMSHPIAQSRAAMDELLDALEDQRNSMEAAVGKVRAELETAHGLIGSIGRETESTALGGSAQLIEALSRVREVAAQTSGTVRGALDQVIAEARESLAAATSEAVRQSVTEPVEAQIQALQTASHRGADAAQAAAERLSRQLVSVAETAAAIEARVTQADTRLDDAQRTDLSRQSELLIEALNSSAIDIAKGLSAEVTELSWKSYLSGDRGIFSRRAVKLLSGGDARDISKRFGEDGEFRDAVRRYIHDFEAMMRRVGADREANALSMTLLSSDIGKLYVALAQATERLR